MAGLRNPRYTARKMTTVEAPELLTVAEAAKYLRVSIDTIRRWCRSGELPCKNLGDRAGYRIKREDIAAFLDRRPAKE